MHSKQRQRQGGTERERERERYRDTRDSEGDIANADPTQLLAVSQYPHVLCPGIDSLHHSPFTIQHSPRPNMDEHKAIVPGVSR